MCDLLFDASKDEKDAQTEYQELKQAANMQGEEQVADAVTMIQKQEQSHKEYFDNVFRQKCK